MKKDEMKMIAFNIIIFERSISLYNYDKFCLVHFFFLFLLFA